MACTSEDTPLLNNYRVDVQRTTRCSSFVAWPLTVILVVGAVAVITVIVLVSTAEENSGYISTSRHYKSAAVVSDHEQCSTIGSDIMKTHNGSAVDAAVATLLCVGVTSAQACGIGGGHFMVIYDTPKGGSQKEVVAINAREVAPQAASKDMFQNVSGAFGALSIAVPAEVRGLHEAWKMFGSLPWKTLVQPTIDMCKEGFRVNDILAKRIRARVPELWRFPDLRPVILKPDGTPYKAGDIMRRPVLAATLQRLADDGPESFYTGRVADDIIQDLSDVGAIITAEDLANYEVEVQNLKPVPLMNNTLHLYAPRLPSGGPILQFMLRILEGFDFPHTSFSELKKKVNLHQTLVETFKFGFAKRSFLGDDTFANVTEVLTNISSDAFIKYIQGQIDLEHTHNIEYYGADYLPTEDHGTSHISIVAPNGGAVSATSSINIYFGSHVYGNKTGIIFNNQMNDFSSPFSDDDWGIKPSEANFIAPGKRPLSSMAPIIILDPVTKRLRLVSGGAGGSHITTMVALTTYLNLMLGVDLKDSVDFPRVHDQLLPDVVTCENSVNKNTISGLRGKGHNISNDDYIGVVCGIERRCTADNTCYYNAVGDARREAVPWGWD